MLPGISRQRADSAPPALSRLSELPKALNPTRGLGFRGFRGFRGLGVPGVWGFRV